MLLLIFLACKADNVCTDGTETCHELDSGRYLALEPADWDGVTPLAPLVYFHGYGSSAQAYADRAWLADGASDAGLLLILPDGVDGRWSNVGSPHADRDEMAFMDDVLTDVRALWPVDEAHLMASGFSQGASLAWDLACYRGDEFFAFFPASGSFWEPLPESCASPVNLRHSHGTNDTVMPLEGRSIGDAHQGNVWEGIDVLLAADGCDTMPDREEQVDDELCQIWETCSSGDTIQLCLHPGKHQIPDNFFDHAMSWVSTL